MTPEKPDHERLKELLIELVDGQPSEEQLDQLQQVAKSVPDGIERMVDHLLLDSLLGDDLGREPLTALVDLVAESVDSDVTERFRSRSQRRTESAAKSPVPSRRSPWFLRTTSWLAVAASVALVVFLLTGTVTTRSMPAPARLLKRPSIRTLNQSSESMLSRWNETPQPTTG